LGDLVGFTGGSVSNLRVLAHQGLLGVKVADNVRVTLDLHDDPPWFGENTRVPDRVVVVLLLDVVDVFQVITFRCTPGNNLR
jgi:hypothetical protein